MGDGIRSIDFMMRRDVVVQAKLRIEEVELVVDHIFAIRISPLPVARILHPIADMAILQVKETIQSLHEFIVHLTIDIPVSLLGIVAIILVVGQQLQTLRHVLHPFHESEVIAVIFIPSATQDRLDVILVVIHQRSHNSKEVVIHLLLADQVALQLVAAKTAIEPVPVRQILNQFAPRLVLLVIAFSLGIVTSHIQIQIA